MNWNGAVAIVTGASTGIGKSVARMFIERGAKVALVARTKATLDEAVRELDPKGLGLAKAFPLDVVDQAALVALPTAVVDAFGRLDIVVNNAGVNHRGPLRKRTADELENVVRTNLTAPMQLTHAALPFLKRGAVVVNVASIAGKVPVPDETSYSASKFGLRAFSRALDFELEDEGIRCISVCPGPVATGFIADTEKVPNLVFSQPMSTPDEIAPAGGRAAEGEAHEIDVPSLSGALATLGYLVPALYKRLIPLLEMRGASNKRRHADMLRRIASRA